MDIREILKNNNIKVTKSRIIIYDILLKSKDSLSADYIYREAKKEDNINLSTVYRTLDLFENKSLVEKIFLGDNKANYRIKRESHKHNLECSLCHKKVEIPCPMNQIEEMLKEKVGFKLVEHDLKLKGICEECSEKRED